ncbi:hypothetical protein ABK040_011370 [Willaertia magna]
MNQQQDSTTSQLKEQCFDYLLILDFEATCEDGDKSFPNEIIEFPTIALNTKTLEIDCQFHNYVKPKINPTLTKFCTELTGIQQEWVDKGETFKNCLTKHQQWLMEQFVNHGKSFCFVTCGDWDLNTMLKKQCEIDNISIPSFYKQWINIKKEFTRIYKEKAYGMTSMLNYFKLELKGRHHSGIDDCLNITRVVQEILKQGHVLEITTKISDKSVRRMEKRMQGDNYDKNKKEEYKKKVEELKKEGKNNKKDKKKKQQETSSNMESASTTTNKKKEYKNPATTTDAIVVIKRQIEIETDEDDGFSICLITRGREPFKGSLAFPGGFIDYGEKPEDACVRELLEETHLKAEKENLQLIAVAGDPKRDPRQHTISIIYAVKIVDGLKELKADDDAANVGFYSLKKLLKGDYSLAFDHQAIVNQFGKWFYSFGKESKFYYEVKEEDKI